MQASLRSFWVCLGFAAALTAAASMPSLGSARAVDPSLERLLGTYSFVGGQKEVREVERAIDEAVDEMNVFIRGIARRRLKDPNLPTDTLSISVDGSAIAVARSGQPTIAAPASGKKTTWRNPSNGNELEVAHRINGEGVLEQVLVGDRGVSKNVFTLTANGRLIMKSTIRAEKLPSTIRFSTTYARR